MRQSLSDYWRVKKSRDEALELKHLQDGLTSLANILGGVRGRKFDARWSHEDYASHKRDAERVFLDAFPIQNTEAPIPGDKTDVIAGKLLREIGRRMFQYPEDKAFSTYYCGAAAFGPNFHDSRDVIRKTIEDIYAESEVQAISLASSSYIMAARQYYRDVARGLAEKSIKACQEGKPTIRDILNLWSLCVTYDEPIPADLPVNVLEALTQLLVLSRHIVREDKKLSWIFKSVWDAVSTFPWEIKEEEQPQQQQEASSEQSEQQEGKSSSDAASEAEGDDESDESESSPSRGEQQQDQGEPGEGEDESEGEESPEEGESPSEYEETNGSEDSESEEAGDSGSTQEAPLADVSSGLIADALDSLTQSLSQDQLDALADAIDYEREDISDQVLQDGDPDKPYNERDTYGRGGRGSGSIIMELGEYDPTLEGRLFEATKEQSSRISNAFDQWERARTHYVRGAEDGRRLDSRLLYRGAMKDRHVFKAKEIMHDLDMAVCVLVDSSSSVGDDSWIIFQHVTAALAQAIGYRQDADLMVMTYSTDRGTTLNRVWDTSRRELRLVRRLNGATPSGESIAACRDVIFKRFSHHKDKLLIHVTDGQPGDAKTVTSEVEACRRMGIHVVCLMIAGEDETTRWYSRTIKYIEKQVAEMYGKDYKILEDWRDLPMSLEELLRGALERRM